MGLKPLKNAFLKNHTGRTWHARTSKRS